MSERDPFDTLRDLIDEPVAPRDAFADGLRSRLMREMSASEHSREEQAPPMDAVFAPRPPVVFPTDSVRRIRPMVILEIAAVAAIILGLVAALNGGWFQNEPDPATAVPAAALQDDTTGTPETRPEETSTPLPTMVPDQGADMTLEPTAVPPGNLPNTIWAVPVSDGEITNFGGMLVDDDTVYRLLATSSFVGVQAVDGLNGTVKWQQAHQWAGSLFAIEDGVLYFDGGDNTLTAINAETGAELWRANVAGGPLALDTDDSRVFVLLDTDFVTALDQQTGDQLWVAQGRVPQNPAGGSVSMPANFKIAVGNDVVAAVSTYGVLSGFDAATGTELWAHEGYDAAMTSIQAEGDLFVVSVGSMDSGELTMVQSEEIGTGDSASPVAVAGGNSLDEITGTVEIGTTMSASPIAAEVTVAGGSSPDEITGTIESASCADFFTPTSFGTEEVAEGTVPAGVAIAGGSTAGSMILTGIQGIDPATGTVVWEQQQMDTLSMESVATGTVFVCVVDVMTGTLQTIPGTADMDTDADNGVVVGIATGQVVVPIQSDDEVAIVSVLTEIGNVSDGPEGFIAIVADESGVYGTMVDGTLIKIGAQQTIEDGQHEDSHGDSIEGTPETDA